MERSLEIQLNECIRWIQCNNYFSVALQFSVPLLKLSASVVKYLESKTGCEYKYFVVYSDTCSVDHLSPLHLGEAIIDAIIRFGNVCLAQMPETVSEFPVLFVFSLEDNSSSFDFAKSWLQDIEDLSRSLILYDTSYTSVVNNLLNQNVLIRENVGKLQCCSNKWSFTSDSLALVSPMDSNLCTFGQFVTEKKVSDFSKLIFIGSQVSLNYRVNTNFEIIQCVNPAQKSVRDIVPNVELRKRMACIETVKSNRCRKVGIIYTNSYPLLNLDYIKMVSAKRGKEVHFVSLVQSTDECKMANFTDLGAFVIVTNCHCSTLIDNVKLHVPLINQTEFEISCGISCKYAGIEWPKDEGESIDEFCNQIVEVNVTDKQLWFGLNVQSDTQEPSLVKEGQTGIAGCYNNEPSNE